MDAATIYLGKFLIRAVGKAIAWSRGPPRAQTAGRLRPGRPPPHPSLPNNAVVHAAVRGVVVMECQQHMMQGGLAEAKDAAVAGI